MSQRFNCLLDQKLHSALKRHAKAAGLTVSQDARDLLRVALGVVRAERTRGWLEGQTAGYAEVLRAAATKKAPPK